MEKCIITREAVEEGQAPELVLRTRQLPVVDVEELLAE